jgi:hypothetical protein
MPLTSLETLAPLNPEVASSIANPTRRSLPTAAAALDLAHVDFSRPASAAAATSSAA